MSMKCRPFSLLFDEATDIGVVKSACMVIRIFDDEAGAVRSEFYNLIELGEKADAQTLRPSLKLLNLHLYRMVFHFKTC